ncbi:MAG: PorT family protein, partial [Chitinophagaceae bacterium]
MRKIYTLTAILLTIGVVQLNAQVTYGIGAGINHSSWKGDAVGSLENLVDLTNGMITPQARNSFYIGGFAEMPLGEKISLQPGVYYSQKGYMLKGNLLADKFDFLGVTARAQLQSHYIDIPLVIKAEVAKGLQIYAGPQLSYLVKNNLRMDAGLLGVSLVNTKMDVIVTTTDG